MANDRSMKDKSMAAHLKKHGIVRGSGACPWGCGRQVTNGGGPLIAHLGQCKGKTRKSK